MKRDGRTDREWIAKHCGITRKYLDHILSGYRKPGLTLAMTLGGIFNVDAGYILGDKSVNQHCLCSACNEEVRLTGT